MGFRCLFFVEYAAYNVVTVVAILGFSASEEARSHAAWLLTPEVQKVEPLFDPSRLSDYDCSQCPVSFSLPDQEYWKSTVYVAGHIR